MLFRSLDDTRKSFLKSSHVGHSLGLAGIEHHKKYYDDALLHARYEEFEYTCFTTQAACPLQLSGNMYPDYDFEGKKLQDLGNWSSPLALVSFFTAPTRDGWAFCFAWHASSGYVCVPFIQSLASSIHDGQRIEDALLRFAFACCENHAFRISWWDGLSDLAKQHIVEKMVLLLDPNTPIPPNYLSAGCEGFAKWSFEYVHTTLAADA